MTEFWGLVLAATIVSIVVSVSIWLLFCGGIIICEYCKRRNQQPLASAENQV